MISLIQRVTHAEVRVNGEVVGAIERGILALIGVRKGETALLGKINASLAKLKANGTIDKILEKWGQKAQG